MFSDSPPMFQASPNVHHPPRTPSAMQTSPSLYYPGCAPHCTTPNGHHSQCTPPKCAHHPNVHHPAVYTTHNACHTKCTPPPCTPPSMCTSPNVQHPSIVFPNVLYIQCTSDVQVLYITSNEQVPELMQHMDEVISMVHHPTCT